MTYATDTFAGDGSTVEFTLTFDYIQRDHVTVYRIENSDQAETELTVITSGDPSGDEYVWETDKKIKVGTAPTDEQKLRIERDTPEDEQLVQWKDGSYIISNDLNTSDKQWLYGLQELEDKYDSLSSTAIKYLGAIDLTVDEAPANPTGGDFFINTGDGTVLDSWTGIAGDDVVGSEQVIYNAEDSEWEIFQVPSSQTGVIEVNVTAPITRDVTDPQRPIIGFDDAPNDGTQYVRQATGDPVELTWAAVDIPPGTVIANPLPTDPEPDEGQLGYNSGDNRLYIWVLNDDDVGSWVDASPATDAGVTQITAGDNITITPEGGTGNVTINAADSMPTGGGDDEIFYENGQEVTEDYTLTTGTNAGSFGTVTINEDATVTVPDDSTWVIVGSNDGTDPAGFWERDGDTLSPANSGDALSVASDRFNVISSGNLELKDADADTVASISANDGSAAFAGPVAIGGTDAAHTIDEYEEGEWTPSVGEGTATVTDATYVRVGKLVTVYALFSSFSNRTSTESIKITGIPFACQNSQATGSMVGRFMDRDAYSTYVSAADILECYAITSGTWAPLQYEHLNRAESTFYITATYEIDD